MKYIKKTLVLSVVFLLMGIYLFPAAKNEIAFAGGRSAVSETAPNFFLTDLYGKKVNLFDYKGKVVLVNFWASWCPQCKMEVPGFQRVYETYKGKGFAIIGIALDEVAPSFINEMGITYPIAMADGKVIKDYGNVSGIPISFLIGKDGRIIKKIMGIYSEGALRGDVDNALKSKS